MKFDLKTNIIFFTLSFAIAACSVRDSEVRVTPNKLTGGVEYSTGSSPICSVLEHQPEAIAAAEKWNRTHSGQGSFKSKPQNIDTNWSLEFIRAVDSSHKETFLIALTFHSENEEIQNVSKKQGLQFNADGKIYSFSTDDSFLENKQAITGVLKPAFTSKAVFKGATRANLQKIASSNSDIKVRVNGTDSPIDGYLHPVTVQAIKNLLASES